MHFIKLQCDEWMDDDALNSCSFETKGFFIKVLCLLSRSPKQGVLLRTNGKPYDAKSLAKKLGCSHLKAKKYLNELRSNKFIEIKIENGESFISIMPSHIFQLTNEKGEE